MHSFGAGVTIEPNGYISRPKISWRRSPRRWQYHESLERKGHKILCTKDLDSSY